MPMMSERHCKRTLNVDINSKSLYLYNKVVYMLSFFHFMLKHGTEDVRPRYNQQAAVIH